MSANDPRRSSARPSDFADSLNGNSHSEGPSQFPPPPQNQNQNQNQNRPARRHRQAPLFTPPDNYTFESSQGPALAPLSFERSTATPQQPLPPLRSLNRGFLAPEPGYLPHFLSQPGSSQQSSPSALQFNRQTSPPLPSVSRRPSSPSNPPSRYRYSARRPTSRNSGSPSSHRIPRIFSTWNTQADAPHDGPSNSPTRTSDTSPNYPYVMSSRTGGGPFSRRDSLCSEDTGRASKRRRVESDKTSAPLYKAFRYGRYGQVEPGALKMEIASCDGGLYKDVAAHSAENILKADNSVYCTKGNRCNIVLQHQGNTPFSLKELIIRAPAKNYSDPVREGVVFLSMSKDELLQKNQYHSRACPSSTTSLFDRINTFRQRAAAHFNTNGYGAQDENSAEDPNGIPEEMYRLALNRSATANAPNARNASSDVYNDTAAGLDNAENPPRFYLVTECSDDEEGPASNRTGRERDYGWQSSATRWSPPPLHTRSQRNQPAYDNEQQSTDNDNWGLGNNYLDDDDDDTELFDQGDPMLSSPESPPGVGEARSRGIGRLDRAGSRAFFVPGEMMRGSGESTPSYNPLRALPSNFNSRSSEAGPSESVPAEAQPDAKFHIEEHNNKCTIRFNPPVTARYILLKMWNPHYEIEGNIDIQGVVAKGYAGPRFYPVQDLR